MVGTTLDNRFGTTRFIVDASGANGSYTTIQAAITAASSGTDIFIRPGTYTENITLKNGVNIYAYNDYATVIIKGTVTMNVAGTVTITGIGLQTNGATALSFSSANQQTLTFYNCDLTSTDADLVTNSNTNSSSNLIFQSCNLRAASTYKAFVASHTGSITCRQTNIGGASTTASTSTSSGGIVIFQGSHNQPYSLSGTAGITAYGINVTMSVTFVTLATGTRAIFYNGKIGTGSASIFDITSTGQVYCFNVALESSNASTVTGTGSFFDGGNSYSSTRNPASSTVTMTNNTIFDGNGTAGQVITSNGANLLPTWQNTGATSFQVVTQTFTGNGTYTPTAGMKFCIVEVVGGGGGGGGAVLTGVGTSSVGGGGGGGGYAKKTFSSGTIGASQSITIGTAGTAGANTGGNGGTGGTTSFGTGPLLSAGGGIGGNGSAAAVADPGQNGGNGGGGSLGDVNGRGGPGGPGFGKSTGFAGIFAGSGGTSFYGSGQVSVLNTIGSNGLAGTGFGGGGCGGANYVNQATGKTGGAGTAGICVITEFVLVSATIVTTLPWTEVTSATQALAVNNGYVTNRVAGVTYTLPASGAVGDVIRISGKSGISTVNQNANQQIVLASASTTVGITGSIASTNTGDCIELICTTGGTSTVWRANGQIGVWSVT